jgi:bifunctional DNA-binding transcriptional regulator/antitoxin component of YhaV-PrlF toxin-antitoxin module
VRLKPTTDAAEGGRHEDHLHAFEELVILDSAGRLSIPREYLDHFHIRRRVRLEIIEDGILIRPPRPDHADSEHGSIQPATADFLEQVGDQRTGPAWLDRSKRLLRILSAKLHLRTILRRKRSDEKTSEGEQ